MVTDNRAPDNIFRRSHKRWRGRRTRSNHAWRMVIERIVLISTVLALFAPGTDHAATPILEKAKSAAEFLDSFGINTHIASENIGRGISNETQTRTARELKYTRMIHVRDDLSIGTHLSTLQALNSLLGVKFDLVYSHYAADGGSKVVTDDISNVQSAADIIEAIEGPNEPDWFGIHYDGITGAPAVISTQQLIYSAVKNNVHLQNVPVYCPGFSYPAPGGLASLVGDLAKYCNYASLHAYVKNVSLGTYLPYAFLVKWASFPDTVTAVGRPKVITEGGWHTAINGSTGVDETTQAKYIPEYLLDAFNLGIRRTYLYELVDDAADPQMTVEEAHYGVFHFDGTPKPAATVLANLNSMLRSEPLTPTSLLYSIDNMPTNGHQTLLEKSDGTFVLALWNEAELWNSTTHVAIPCVGVKVLLHLGAPVPSVQIFDPLVGTAAQQTSTYVQDLVITLLDHPILIFIATKTTR